MRKGYRAAWRTANVIFRLLFARRVHGAEFIPRRGGFIIACNHISFWDPPLVGATVPREVHFLAKEELFRNRAFGWLISSLNAIPIRRGPVDPGGIKAALQALRAGKGLVMFPEGGRVKEGALKPALPGVGLLSVKADVPVVPAYVRGSDTIRRAVARLTRIDIAFGEPCVPPPLRGGRENRELYRAVGEEVMNRIAELKGRIDAEA
ncbi:MAG: 1-acyl-sn-glycerol-3-phosphate acyltransferase [Candidatus Eiseniibacteriota bacterium]|nr:MAG: 1-acyl-sn-glycerol-3-phosphate acyltransferase [Candidatus Eisenbacteria bacterium]